MKETVYAALLVIGLSAFTACNNESEVKKEDTPAPAAAAPEPKAEETEFSVTGKITGIEKGKDGYMATIEDSTGKKYTATISIVNLQKSGGTYKAHEVGETITVQGPGWSDSTGNTFIMAKQLH